jgi:transposase
MSLAELVITSVLLEGRSKSEVARDYRISRYWVHQLVTRFQVEGEAAYQPRSRRPHRSPHAVSAEVEERIIRLRKELSKQGLDAGAETIRVHLQRHPDGARVPAVSTIWRVLSRRGFITPQPRKRPRSAGTRFEACQPNERWQADITHWQLADGTGVEILNIEDDHSRLDLASDARPTTSGEDVLTSFRRAFARHGIPARVLTDNAAVFTGKPRRGGRVALEIELDLLRVRLDHSRAYHPQTCGKVERFHQTQKKWLAAHPPRCHPRRAPAPARPVPPLRQHHPTPPRAQPCHPRAGLRGQTQGPPRRTPPGPALPRPPRPHRHHRGRHPALQQPTPPHRPRPRTRRQAHLPPRRRPLHPHHRRRNRPTPPRAHPRPRPRLPAPRPTTRPTKEDLKMQRCPDTPVNGVPRHHIRSG